MNQVVVALLVATLSSLGGVTVTASDTKTNAVSSAAVNKAVAASVGGKTMKIKQINYVPGTAAPSQQTTKTYKQVIQPNLDAPAEAWMCLAYVAGAFGGASGYATAAMAADDAPVMYNNQDFPENVYVPVFFRFMDQAHGSVGHVVIWDGYKKEFLSTGSSNGHITFHSVDEVLAWLRGSGDVEYIGWSTEMPIDHQWRPVVD